MATQAQYDVVILGGGAAGLSAALYTTRAMLKTVVLEKTGVGGQILLTGDIENYPGFPKGIQGPELARLYEEQARRFGAEIEFDEVLAADLEGPVKRIKTSEGEFTTKTVIIATGGEHNKLGVPGEDEFSGRGVSYCATCDGNFFKGMDVTVVGGGDAAMDEGLYLTQLVNSVNVVHRRDTLRATKLLQERAFSNPKMKFTWNSVVEEIKGNGAVDKLVVKDLTTNKVKEQPTQGIFIFIGFHPNTAFLKQAGVKLDNGGHVITDMTMHTNIPGVFAAGDVRSQSERQLGVAVGDGITAALSAFKYITEG